jgi:hypothetical protein
MEVVGTICALTLTVLVGVCASSVRPIEHADARWMPVATGARSKDSLSAERPGHLEKLVGVHEPSAPGRLELPHHTRKPLPPLERFAPRHGLAPGPEPRLAARPGLVLGGGMFRSHGRIADRPVVANCPAQGPPRTA